MSMEEEQMVRLVQCLVYQSFVLIVRQGLQNLTGFISFDAQFDSSAQDPDRQCHPGTRQNVLKRLRDWADNPKAKERIFWLYGPAAAGKSAIAQTIAYSYQSSCELLLSVGCQSE